ncbi:MAG: hypothetical protein Kow00117_18950 [Phototrophicales bacterium]
MRKQILVLSKDQQAQESIQEIFSQTNVEVMALDSFKALANVLKQQTIPDIMLIDLTMDFARCLELVQFLRKKPNYAQMPIMVMTDIPSPEQIKAIMAAGASRYISKVFLYNTLLDTTSELLNVRIRRLT